jgi:hypothetical protein
VPSQHEAAPCSEMISPSTCVASTAPVEEVVARGDSASCVQAGTSSGDVIEGCRFIFITIEAM